MKTLALVVAVFAVAIGAALYVRYRYYRNWKKFLDDLAEKLALDFLPGPVKIALLFVLVVWGGSAIVSYLTAELRHKDPSAQPLGQSAPISELAKAADLPGGVPQAPGGGLENQQAGSQAAEKALSDLAGGAPSTMPDLSVLAQQQVPPAMDPQQLAEMEKMRKETEKALEQMRQQQMASLPKPEPEDYFRREPKKKKSDENKDDDEATANPVAKKPAVKEMAKIEVPRPVHQGKVQVLLSRAKIAGAMGVEHDYVPEPVEINAPAEVVRTEMPDAPPMLQPAVEAYRAQYGVVVKASGRWFEGRLIHKGMRKMVFERPDGDIVSLPRDSVKKIIEAPHTWPITVQ